MSDRNGHAPPTSAADPADDGPIAYRSPIQGLADLAELLAGESAGSKRFLGGLALGALVGAAIAGSTIWQRRQLRRAKSAAETAAVELTPGAEPAGTGPGARS